MRAITYRQFGGPEVLTVGDVPEPHAGPGQIRIAVRAAGLNPIDWKLFGGLMGGPPPTSARVPGMDAAGVVDEVGEGVVDVAPGDAVFGAAAGGSLADLAVLEVWATKPDTTPWAVAGGLPGVGETAVRTLDAVGLVQGETLVVDGAAGGVGLVAVQLAILRGARVIGTASAGNHDVLRSFGAIPTTYGPGLADRVRRIFPDGVDAALDTAGKGSVPTSSPSPATRRGSSPSPTSVRPGWACR